VPTSFPAAGALRTAHAGLNHVSVASLLAATLVTAFVAGHVPFVRDTLDGIDSANFVLAVDRYDPGQHQPHPPGYPVHVALGRLVNTAIKAFTPEGSLGEWAAPAASLRIWSVLSGALAVSSLMWIAIELGAPVTRAWLVAALAAACPLFWITAMRPLSDVPGLSLALISQALALAADNHRRAQRAAAFDSHVTDGRANYLLVAAGLLAGIAVGVRLQTALLTLPLLALVTGLRVWHGDRRAIALVPSAVAVGVLVWGLPMMSAVGGIGEYFRLVTTIAADDVQGVDMLATRPSPRLLALALFRTFIVPWGSPVLGAAVLGLAALGALALVRHNRRVLAFLIAMGLPYLLFHLLFQETASIRYALPIVPVCCLIVVARLPSRSSPVLAAVVAVVLVTAGTLSVRAAAEYGESESPVARAIEDIKEASSSAPRVSALAFHHSVARALRGETWPGRTLAAPVRYEWLELASYWLAGGVEPVWFLADGRRTDLALIDPSSRTLVRSYRWPAGVEPLLGGIQPAAVSWYEIVSPGWFLMRGWAVTPDVRGLASRDGHSAGATGIVGHVRRRSVGATMMVGGRNLGGPAETGAQVDLYIDGRRRATWVTPSGSSFLQVIPLAEGELAGDGGYARLELVARDIAGTARVVDVAIEHFDVQSPGAALAGFDHGWHMQELDPATGRSWRWTDQAAELRVEGFGRDVELVIRGESPLADFQRPPRVMVKAGQTELGSFLPDADFEWTVSIPAAALAASEGRITIESDQAFTPDETSGNGDRRRLALRITRVETKLGS
jgi:hypothetical protein